jgi:hypothetical protein
MHHQQNHANEELGTLQIDTSGTYDDSGYAEFEADLQSWDQHLQDNTETTYIRSHSSRSASLYQRDSSILFLDTSPPPSSPGLFENIANHSQLSTSSLESYLPDFSAMAPQPMNPNSRPMTPFSFKRNAIRRLNDTVHMDNDAPPSSAAEPPPPTFCLPSPKHEAVVSSSPMSQANVPNVLLPQQESTRLRSPSFSPTSSEQNSAATLNLLDEADPWDAIGRLLDLKKTSMPPQSSASARQPTTKLLGMLMNDRSGVGYVAPQVEDKVEEGFVRDTGIQSEVFQRTLLDEHINHCSSPHQVRRSSLSPSPVPTTNIAAPSDPSVSTFLASILSTEPQGTDNGGDVTSMESLPFVGETSEKSWLTFSDEYPGSDAGVPRPSENPASIPAANPSSSIPVQHAASLARKAERVQTPVEIPNFQGPCLFFDLEEDDECSGT